MLQPATVEQLIMTIMLAVEQLRGVENRVQAGVECGVWRVASQLAQHTIQLSS